MAIYSYHEVLWLSCATKRCCWIRTVRPTGGDIWRIASQLHVPPESFLRTVPVDTATEDGVLLAVDGKPIHIALARRVVTGRRAACQFLMHINDGVARCGLGPLRPLPCQTFPTTGASGALYINESNSCTCRTWSIGDVDRVAAAALLEREAAERELDRQITRSWNEQVAITATTYRLADYCQYLMQAYSRHTARQRDKAEHEATV